MKYLLIGLMILGSFTVFSKESEKERKADLASILSDSRCQFIVSGENSELEQDPIFNVNRGVEQELKVKNDLSVRDTVNPFLRYSDVAPYFVMHNLDVTRGDTSGTININLITSCPQRGGACDRENPVELKNVSISGLDKTLRWEFTNTVRITCI